MNNESILYSACFYLNEIYQNEIMIDLKRLRESDDLNNYIWRVLQKSKDRKLIEAYRSTINFTTNLLDSKSYFIFKDLFCLLVQNFHDFNVFPKVLDHKTDYFLFQNRSYDLVDVSRYKVFQQFLVYKNTKCDRRKISKFLCLNRCVKKKQNISKYFFSAHETKSIYLKYNESDKLIKDNENECSLKCRRHKDCELIYIQTRYVGKKSHRKQPKTIVFKAYFLVSDFSFFVNFFGLICSFLNISLFHILLKLFVLFNSIVQKIKDEKTFVRLKLLFTFFLIVLAASLCLFSYFKYLKRRDYPIEKEIWTSLLQTEPVDLVICAAQSKGNFSLLKSEETGNEDFKESIDDIYIEYDSKKIKIRWDFAKVVFKGQRVSNITYLLKCYIFHIFPEELKFQRQVIFILSNHIFIF